MERGESKPVPDWEVRTAFVSFHNVGMSIWGLKVFSPFAEPEKGNHYGFERVQVACAGELEEERDGMLFCNTGRGSVIVVLRAIAGLLSGTVICHFVLVRGVSISRW